VIVTTATVDDWLLQNGRIDDDWDRRGVPDRWSCTSRVASYGHDVLGGGKCQLITTKCSCEQYTIHSLVTADDSEHAPAIHSGEEEGFHDAAR